MIRRLKYLETASEVIDALGGTDAAAKIAGVQMPAISNARARNKLPSATFLIFSDALAAVGKRARPALWGIKPSRRGARRAAHGENLSG